MRNMFLFKDVLYNIFWNLFKKSRCDLVKYTSLDYTVFESPSFYQHWLSWKGLWVDAGAINDLEIIVSEVKFSDRLPSSLKTNWYNCKINLTSTNVKTKMLMLGLGRNGWGNKNRYVLNRKNHKPKTIVYLSWAVTKNKRNLSGFWTLYISSLYTSTFVCCYFFLHY